MNKIQSGLILYLYCASFNLYLHLYIYVCVERWAMDVNLELLLQIILRVPNYIFWKDNNLTYQGANQNFANSLGFENVDQLIGKTDYEIPSTKALAHEYQQEDQHILQGGESILGKEVRIKKPNEQDKILSISKVPLYGSHNEIIGVLGIYIDITSIKEHEQLLLKAKEQAEAASRAKTEFIANMSHDIRTPLTGVIGLSEVLEHTLKNPEEREKAHMLHDSGEVLLRLLNDILDDVQADNLQNQDIKKYSFDLHQCINELIRLESPATTLKHLELKQHIAPNVPRYINSDKNKIYRILLNLMGNAIKFTQTGSITLEIECLHLDEFKAHLKFGVSDTGIGIPEEAQSQIFNRFFKVSSSYKGIYTGNGLGLHIVQSYVTLLGGHITLTSREGVGSTFNFDLECELGEAPVTVIPISQSTSESMKKTYHLLLIEDNGIALKTLEYLLTQQGYTFKSATTGEQALALFQEEPFDLIVTDIGLPGISGNELSKNIRTQSSIPIIALTGHDQGEVKEECLNAGINEVLSKPAQIEVVHETIQKLMQNASKELKDVSSNSPPKPSLGFDLPDTEEELFQLEHFPLFDEVQALKQIPGKAMIISMLQIYLSERMQQDIQQLQEYYRQQDWECVEKTAHKIKGGVSYLGTQKLRYACQYLERYYKVGHRSLLEPLYHQVLKVNDETIQELTRWLRNNAP